MFEFQKSYGAKKKKKKKDRQKKKLSFFSFFVCLFSGKMSSEESKPVVETKDDSQPEQVSLLSGLVETMNIYNLDGYTFGTKAEGNAKSGSHAARMRRMREQFEQAGQRRTVHGVLLAHLHGHAHILLLQQETQQSVFKLPGGKLKVGEDEADGLARKLTKNLAPVNAPPPDWLIGETIAMWWRPNFETYVV
jgi:Nucleotide hydrolase